MKTLSLEQITALESQHAKLVATARAGAWLASLCRGAIRGCDAKTDPNRKLKEILSSFLELAGFEVCDELMTMEDIDAALANGAKDANAAESALLARPGRRR